MEDLGLSEQHRLHSLLCIASVHNCSILSMKFEYFLLRWYDVYHRSANIWAANKIFIFTTEILRRNLSAVYAERLETVPDQLYWLCGYKMYTRGLKTQQLETWNHSQQCKTEKVSMNTFSFYRYFFFPFLVYGCWWRQSSSRDCQLPGVWGPREVSFV